MSTPDLVETLRDAQRFGFFGSGPIESAIDHAGAFVAALGEVPDAARIIDLGSGGGLPGLVLAEAFPSAEVLLVDRREKRTDFLERAVSRLGWSHVRVWSADVEVVAAAVERGDERRFDVVTARGFGPPDVTLGFGRRLVAPDGRILISEPPPGSRDRWDDELLGRWGVTSERVGPVRLFRPS